MGENMVFGDLISWAYRRRENGLLVLVVNEAKKLMIGCSSFTYYQMDIEISVALEELEIPYDVRVGEFASW